MRTSAFARRGPWILGDRFWGQGELCSAPLDAERGHPATEDIREPASESAGELPRRPERGGATHVRLPVTWPGSRRGSAVTDHSYGLPRVDGVCARVVERNCVGVKPVSWRKRDAK